jgi:hypothetical protein
MMLILIVAGLAFLALMFYQAYRGQMSYAQPQNGPIVTARAKLIRKETHVSTNIDAGGAVMSEDVYQLVFSLDTDAELSFRVGGRAYGNTPENEWGTLTYQGTRFLGFEYRAGDS